ncbi:MAG: AAA family ATPase [bacterium]
MNLYNFRFIFTGFFWSHRKVVVFQFFYCGADVEEDLLKNLIYAAGGSIKRAECGIICIDEIDKLSSGNTPNKASVSREGVAMRLLKIIEGHNVSLNTRGNSHRASERFDTNLTSFIVTGAFSGISMFTRRESTIGFRGNIQHQECDDIYYTIPDMYGDVQGIIGASLPEIRNLELKALADGSGNS